MTRWIFQSNPTRFDLLAEWSDGKKDFWSANQHREEMQPGDVVYFRVSGRKAGLYGKGTILSSAYPSKSEFGKWKVDIRYDELIDPPLLRSETDEVTILREFPALKGREATNFVIPDEIEEEIEKLLTSRGKIDIGSSVSKLSKLNSRQAVLDAITEYDEIGQEEFLNKYGFGASREYKLIYENREYDSKAIVGVAYKNQFGVLLAASDFSGGHATVQKKLESLGFTVRGSKPPAWVRDELILALDLYLRFGSLDDNSPEVRALSAFLNQLPIHPDWRFAPGFRNANGVAMKIANFMALDPTYKGVGLSAGSKGDKEIWKEFHDKPDVLAKLAKSIREGAVSLAAEIPEDGEDEAAEGRILTRIHRARERNQKLVKKRKAQRRLECGGALTCEVCDFDFFEMYGDRGDGYAECHHKVPLSESGSTKTRLEDLAILCANCHRMIHVRKPTLTIDELRNLINA